MSNSNKLLLTFRRQIVLSLHNISIIGIKKALNAKNVIIRLIAFVTRHECLFILPLRCSWFTTFIARATPPTHTISTHTRAHNDFTIQQKSPCDPRKMILQIARLISVEEEKKKMNERRIPNKLICFFCCRWCLTAIKWTFYIITPYHSHYHQMNDSFKKVEIRKEALVKIVYNIIDYAQLSLIFQPVSLKSNIQTILPHFIPNVISHRHNLRHARGSIS